MSILSDVYQEYLERERVLRSELSRAEERERVLLDALTRIKASMEVLPWAYRLAREDAFLKVIDAALTAAPEQGKEAKS